jgi:phage terminase small subunit
VASDTPAKLTAKQRRFVAEYLLDGNATQAAVRAGYSPRSAHSIANELLEKPEVRAAVDAAEARRLERLDLKADDILRELLTFARTDIRKAFDKNGRLLPIHEMPEDVARAISGVKVFEEFDGTGSGA